MSARVRIRDAAGPSVSAGLGHREIFLALAVFAVLCVAVLRYAPALAEPDDFAYRGSIAAMTQGHVLTLPTAQFHALSVQLARSGGFVGPQGMIAQWVQLASGRWISEKDPGYPFLAAPFQALGIIRWAPLFYGALGCVGLFFGARRWLGRFGGAAAVGLTLAASWFRVWGLYAAYTWTAQPGGSSLQVVRFYVPALGAIALLGACPVVRMPPRGALAALASAAVVVATFGLGIWSCNDMRVSRLGGVVRNIVQGRHGPLKAGPGGPGGPPRPADGNSPRK